MDCSMASSENANNIVTQNYLEELLEKVITVKASVSEKESAKTKASDELDSLSNKIYQAIATETALKTKHMLSPKLLDVVSNQDIENEKNYEEKFNQLLQILGISINCSPERKLFEITFNDELKSRVSFIYNDKGIEIEEMHPVHQNFDAIRDNLRETGDLLGFLTVFSRRVTNA